MAKEPAKHLLVQLDTTIHTELKHLATDEKTSMADIVRECIKTRIEKSKMKVVY